MRPGRSEKIIDNSSAAGFNSFGRFLRVIFEGHAALSENRNRAISWEYGFQSQLQPLNS